MTAADDERFFSSVRLPSHVDPPYRARQFWNDNGTGTIIGQTLQRWQTNWNGQPTLASAGLPGLGQGARVPDGHRAELVWLSLKVIDETGILFIPSDFTLTVYRDAQVVPGFFRMKTGFEFSNVIVGITGVLTAPSPRVCVPIHFEEGQTCDLEIVHGLGESLRFYDLRWCGWVYPVSVEGESGSIRQTLQDPGVGSPLQQPTQAPRRRRR